MTVTEFLSARLDEIEAVAKAATQGDWQATDQGDWRATDQGDWRATETAQEEPDRAVVYIDHPKVPGAVTVLFEADWGTLADASHIARHDPARTLREVEAKRRLIEEFAARSSQGVAEIYLATLAAVYSDHPDYDSGWGAR